MKYLAKSVIVITLASILTSCGYVRLLRPSVLEELDPKVVALVNELPNLDHPNDAVVAKLYALGGLARAEEGLDGTLHVDVTVPRNQYIWSPAIIVMPHGGELELAFDNPDQALHMAFLPSNGGRQLLHLPAYGTGLVKIRLDEPGWYWWGCPVSNHAGRGMLGFIFVYGDTPEEARLDRPTQPQPEDL